MLDVGKLLREKSGAKKEEAVSCGLTTTRTRTASITPTATTASTPTTPSTASAGGSSGRKSAFALGDMRPRRMGSLVTLPGSPFGTPSISWRAVAHQVLFRVVRLA